MSSLFSAQNSWIRYFTELSTGSALSSDGSHATTRVEGADAESGMDFEAVLQRIITEYGATKDHLEMLEKKLTKMLEIKEAKARSDYEIAKKNYALSEKETTLIRQILGREPDVEGKDWEDDDATIKAGSKRHEDKRSGTPEGNLASTLS
ncbi:hypothetical protein CPB86DRAFT_177590 [Serendipita vermifera]|nr:hypothetical protein CPB86DRAFT_177590 [Serendipita vermifera]